MRPHFYRQSFKPFLVSLLVLLVTLACQLEASGMPLATGIAGSNEGGDAPSDWYALYFSQPESPSSKSLRGGPDRALAEDIRQVRVSVDVAAQQLDLWSLRDALIAAHRQGVQVRIVTESDYMDGEEIQELIQAGIPVLGDRGEGLMHDKFMVLDRQEVCTGSMNFTVNGAYRNDNNLICIRSKNMADDYTTEFEEMFVNKRFGSGSPANTPYQTFGLNGALLEVYFSPDDGTAARLVALIHEAQESIHFLVYSFTSEELADALIAQARAGLRVEGVLELSQAESNYGAQFERLRQAGIEVRLDNNPRSMHHKVIILDEEVVVTGSYNFSYSAETKNDENTLIIHQPEIAASFVAEFKRIFDQAR
jgi:phosphatidylserine/phosphatidylglycerophosphate/cardiolipin synthase-like enzyme